VRCGLRWTDGWWFDDELSALKPMPGRRQNFPKRRETKTGP
jgi:hypothetical protein